MNEIEVGDRRVLKELRFWTWMINKYKYVINTLISSLLLSSIMLHILQSQHVFIFFRLNLYWRINLSFSGFSPISDLLTTISNISSSGLQPFFLNQRSNIFSHGSILFYLGVVIRWEEEKESIEFYCRRRFLYACEGGIFKIYRFIIKRRGSKLIRQGM